PVLQCVPTASCAVTVGMLAEIALATAIAFWPWCESLHLICFLKSQDRYIEMARGCQEYTGALYFAAITAHKVGTNVTYVCCIKNAATIFRSETILFRADYSSNS
uniref:Uncharacterized protein n=1 Tax=Phasianus colchicus TaxID=9054 RepID=A0A669PJP0_PHACC